MVSILFRLDGKLIEEGIHEKTKAFINVDPLIASVGGHRPKTEALTLGGRRFTCRHLYISVIMKVQLLFDAHSDVK